MRDLDAPLAREVAVELELLLELQSLVARVRLTSAPTLRWVRSCTQHTPHESSTLQPYGPIDKISYDLPFDYRKFVVRSTYDSDLKRAEIYLRNIVSYFTNITSDDITILHLNLTYEKLSIHYKMFCKLDVRRNLIVTLALS